ncbi:cytochrome c [Polaribacter pacificus]|uniref:Cytochrome c n=1 Tax=Polaribacter pacificus TaxID=1775173 RepID=A0A917HUH2_9FLAO|nr:SH3 domain-containing C40 family peptidase [Polaribacter pacificus]GGG89430.1 cytochrome c [Polaribacter pacificus]
MKSVNYFLLFSLFLSIACTTNTKNLDELKKISANVKQEFAPDSRVAIFNIQMDWQNNSLHLEGESTQRKAVEALADSLNKLGISYKNTVRILPDSAVNKNVYAVGRNSVINIRSAAKHSAELGTQGLLGMSIKVLDKKGDFYRIQTPDNYISWVDKGGIQLMDAKQFSDWEAAPKILFSATNGYAYSAPTEKAQIVSDLVFGNLLKLIEQSRSYYKVAYPDGRIGYVKKEDAVLYNDWKQHLSANGDEIEKASRTMLGVPYLWGGTSTKGMDCSGFTKMVYLMNGFVIPRDASQQINAGKKVDENLAFEGLEKGDLLFFGTPATKEKKQRVTHVGIWLGNDKGEFIHASGNVHLSSINEDQPNYDAFNKGRYLGSKRYLGVKDPLLMELTETTTLKD